MSLQLFMDHHIDGRITRALRNSLANVITAEEDGSDRLPDPQLLSRSTELGRVLVSRDVDLIIEASARLSRGDFFAGLIYGSQLSGSIGRSVYDLELLSTCCDPAEFHNHIEFLPLRE